MNSYLGESQGGGGLGEGAHGKDHCSTRDVTRTERMLCPFVVSLPVVLQAVCEKEILTEWISHNY